MDTGHREEQPFAVPKTIPLMLRGRIWQVNLSFFYARPCQALPTSHTASGSRKPQSGLPQPPFVLKPWNKRRRHRSDSWRREWGGFRVTSDPVLALGVASWGTWAFSCTWCMLHWGMICGPCIPWHPCWLDLKVVLRLRDHLLWGPPASGCAGHRKAGCLRWHLESIPQAREGGRSSWVLSTVSRGCEGTSEVHLLEAGPPGWAVTSRPQLSRCRTRSISNRDVVTGRPETSLLGPLGHLYDPWRAGGSLSSHQTRTPFQRSQIRSH